MWRADAGLRRGAPLLVGCGRFAVSSVPQGDDSDRAIANGWSEVAALARASDRAGAEGAARGGKAWVLATVSAYQGLGPDTRLVMDGGMGFGGQVARDADSTPVQ